MRILKSGILCFMCREASGERLRAMPRQAMGYPLTTGNAPRKLQADYADSFQSNHSWATEKPNQ